MPRILAFAPHRKKKVKLSWSVPRRRVWKEGSAANGHRRKARRKEDQNEENRRDRGRVNERWNESSLK